MSRISFNSSKVKAGIEQRWQEANEGVKPGEPSASGAVEYVADWLLARHEVIIRARFARIGLKMPEDGPLTVESIRDMVRSKTGLEIEDLSADGIMQAVDVQLSAQLSEKLGLTVSTVFNVDAAKEEIKGQLLEKLANGDGAGILKGAALTRLRSVATFRRAGFDEQAQSRALGRVYQKRYRRKNREVWD